MPIDTYFVKVLSEAGDCYNTTLEGNSSISLSNFMTSLDCQTLNVSVQVSFEGTRYVLERNHYVSWLNGSVTKGNMECLW